MLPIIVFSGLLIVVVGGEFERVLETMYGSRPGNMDSLVIPSREGYYKYEELSETHETSTRDTPDTTVSSTHGYGRMVSGRGHGTAVSAGGSMFGLLEPGSCYQCSSLDDKTGLCQDISLYEQQRLANTSDLPNFVTQCSHSEKYCQVRRVDYKVDNMDEYAQWSLERGCVRECDPFCVSMGGRTKVTYCTSCCRWDGSVKDDEGKWRSGPRNDFCNTDNFAFNVISNQLLILFFTSVVLMN